jgi:hypothetical protein
MEEGCQDMTRLVQPSRGWDPLIPLRGERRRAGPG